MLEDSSVGLWTLFYGVLALCQLFPPTEIIMAGLTVEKLLAPLFGNERLDFITYHMRRSTANWVAHWCMPLVYAVGVCVADRTVLQWGWPWYPVLTAVSCVAALRPLLRFRAWLKDAWLSHPLVKTLLAYSPDGHWKEVAVEINLQFRSFDKFATDAQCPHRVLITDNWLLYTTQYSVQVLHVDDVRLELEATTEPHRLSENNFQTVTCRVISLKSAVQDFHIRITSDQLPEVRHRLGRRVANLRNIVIHQTLTERFVGAFCQVVDDNLPVYSPEPLESCIGCGEAPSTVQLIRQCGMLGAENPCRECHCRPMWCMSCFAKWFASRQDQTAPETWLSSKCPCPTCRSTFCMLDVKRVITNQQSQ